MKNIKTKLNHIAAVVAYHLKLILEHLFNKI